MKPFIVVTTAPWATERNAMVERLERELDAGHMATGVPYYMHRGTEQASHVPNYTDAITEGIKRASSFGCTHITLLPDDAILVPHFVEALSRLIEQRPDDHLCLLSNHPSAKAAFDAGAVGYTTSFGSVLFGGTLRVSEWEDYLRWRDEVLTAESRLPFDNGVNLWLALQGRKTFKPLPSLCEHDTSLDSMLGNQWQENDPTQRAFRHSAVFHADADLRQTDWRGPFDPEGLGHMIETSAVVPDLGATFPNQAWELVYATKPESWDIERMYELARGTPVDANHVMLATPAYAGTELAMVQSRDMVERDLHTNGIKVTRLTTTGDSLVTRGRHSLVHSFLSSPCSHLLMWDADIECVYSDTVRKMMATGYDVIGGAYPYRDGTGKVVCSPLIDGEYVRMEMRDDMCMPVREIGTGFLLLSRASVIKLAMAHPDTLYRSDMFDTRGAPMWALMDAKIVNRRYLSEDYYFCHLWRQLGGEVLVYGPAQFRHWGKLPSDGHIATAWKKQFGGFPGLTEAAE